MKNTLYIAILIFFGISISNQTKAQGGDVYRTQNGNMIITVVSADTVLKITTKELLVLLNYNNANITIKMDKSTFKTGNDSLDKKLALLKYDIITFKGKLNIDYINTNGHPPLDFEVKGIISTNQKIIAGSGHLEHISSHGLYSCLLTLKFNLKISDLGINIEGLHLKDEIQIEVVQAVLNETSNY